MSVRRKSNWYIYFISFGIALVFAIMVIVSFRNYLFPQAQSTGIDAATGQLSDSFVPTSEYNSTIMAMLSDESGSSPSLFLLIAYNAVESRLTFIPIPEGISIPADGRTLSAVYDTNGGARVCEIVQNAAGVSCDKFMKLDRESFTSLAIVIGNVQFDVPETVIVKDGVEAITFARGTELFSAEEIFRYIMLAEFEGGESYRENMTGSMLTELINQNIEFMSSSLLDTYAGLITTNTDTNITAEDYYSHKAALLNTVTYQASPAEYYVPYGEYTADGGFVISENSVITIRQKTGEY